MNLELINFIFKMKYVDLKIDFILYHKNKIKMNRDYLLLSFAWVVWLFYKIPLPFDDQEQVSKHVGNVFQLVHYPKMNKHEKFDNTLFTKSRTIVLYFVNSQEQ